MSNHYFENFSTINYGGYTCTNILARPKILKRVSRNPYAFYPLQLRQGDRPDTVSEAYYGSFFYSWIVLLSNNILDPYFGWQMTQQIFQEFIAEKYNSFVAANRKILNFRVNWDADPSVILPNAYDAMPDYQKKYYAPMFVGHDIVSYDRAKLPYTSTTNYYQVVTISSNTIFAVGDLVSTQLNGLIVSTSEIVVNNGAALVLQHIQGDPGRYIQYEFASGNYLTPGESANVANVTFAVTANVISSNGSTIIVSCDGTYPTGVVTVTGGVSGNVTTTSAYTPYTSILSADYSANGLVSGNVAVIQSSDYLGPCVPVEELAYWEPYLAYEYEDERNSALQNIRLLDVSYRNQTLSDLIRLMK